MQEILIDISEYMTQNLGADLLVKSGALIEKIAPLFSMGFGIYVLLLVFYYYGRGLDESVLDLSKRLLGWFVVIACAFNASMYTNLAVVLYGLPEELIGWFNETELNVDLLSSGVKSIQDMVAALDDLVGGRAWYYVQLQGTVFAAKVVVSLCGLILVVFAYFFYLIAKLSLALTLMVGPLFLGALLFPSTRQYGMNWIGQVLNYSLACLLYAVISVLQLNFVQSKMAGWANKNYIDSVAKAWEVSYVMVIMTILFLIVVLSIPNIASALTGGAAIDGQGRTMGRLGSLATRTLSKVPVIGAANKIIGK
ncbi:type IV secretion system protein [Paenalcaligenes hermetiae]|uniref:Type IV secretion system protein n=2 Tax=Paenalcaligenes TaxID=1100891 RepID=A0ABP9MBT2_9BURK